MDIGTDALHEPENPPHTSPAPEDSPPPSPGTTVLIESFRHNARLHDLRTRLEHIADVIPDTITELAPVVASSSAGGIRVPCNSPTLPDWMSTVIDPVPPTDNFESDSDDEPITMSSTSTTDATVTSYPGSTKAPILGEGHLTISAAVDFKEAAEMHFLVRTIKPEDQVATLLLSFRDTRHKNWIRMKTLEKDWVKTTSFSTFWDEFLQSQLDPNWQDTVATHLRSFNQPTDGRFTDWAYDFLAKSSLLNGTTHAINNDRIRAYLTDLSNPALKVSLRKSKYKDETDLHKWIALVGAKYDSMLEKTKAEAEIAALAARAAMKKKKRTSLAQKSSPKRARHRRRSSRRSSPSDSDSDEDSDANDHRCPKLTEQERDLLMEYDGCLRCREFFADHIARDCQSWPKMPYQRRTREMAEAAKKARKASKSSKRKSTGSSSTTSKKGKVAATRTTNSASGDETETTQSISAKVAATRMRHDSDSEDDSFVSPLTIDPVPWRATALGQGDFPTAVTTLLDGCSSITLVSEHCRKKLGLVPKPLKKPIGLSLAIPSNATACETSTSRPADPLYDTYVRCTLSSNNNSWSSCVFTAVVVPELIDDVDFILGIPFLTRNDLNFRYDNLTKSVHVTAPGCDFDLVTGVRVVQPLPSTVHPPRRAMQKLSSMEKKAQKDAMRPVLDELLATTSARSHQRWASTPLANCSRPSTSYFHDANIILRSPFPRLIDFGLQDNDDELLWPPLSPRTVYLLTTADVEDEWCLVSLSHVDTPSPPTDIRDGYDDDTLEFTSFVQARVAAVVSTIESGAFAVTAADIEAHITKEFGNVFDEIPPVDQLPTEDVCSISLIDAERQIKTRSYASPRKYREAWRTIINSHLAAGRIRPSDSTTASPSFLIPKADPTALPRWVIDYRQLNANVKLDRQPLPRVDDILADAAKGRYWAKFDMTNSFFQTRMNPKDIPLTATTTPLGLYEWTVMPMGFKNSPQIHQRRMTRALRKYIGRFCHVYLDDIIVWSNSIREHQEHLRLIMLAVQHHRLYLNRRKSVFCATEIHFLGHVISRNGIKPDGSKVDRISQWPVPKCAKDVRRFLGLVRYLDPFLPNLAEPAQVLNRLTTKEANAEFPEWTPSHQRAFDKIKALVLSSDCLTTIDHDSPGDNHIFVTCDASERGTGAVLSFGPSWELARPVAFYSKPLNDAERNYPVHEKEMLAIVRALKKWRADLIGTPFFVYTDHRTLEYFHVQRDLSRRQLRWNEVLADYDGKIVYIKGNDNTVADALSRIVYPDSDTAQTAATPLCDFNPDSLRAILEKTDTSPIRSASCLASIARELPITHQSPTATEGIHKLSVDSTFLDRLRAGYETDSWIQTLRAAAPGMKILSEREGVWYVGNRLIVPNVPSVREHIFRLCHDSLGHFGFRKSYEAIRSSFYWPNMRTQLESAYIPSCDACQRNKDAVSKPAGPLHPLPVPEERCTSIAMDFIGPLPVSDGFDTVLTITDRMGADMRFIPCKSTDTAEEIASLFFTYWYCENGLPADIVTDRDKLFTSTFWRAFTKLAGIDLKLTTAFHPQTDGSSERTNKTLVQAIRFHVDENQSGWAKSLPIIRFHLMNTFNSSLGYTPFQLRFGYSPRMIPPLQDTDRSPATQAASAILDAHRTTLLDAQDNLTTAKITQAAHANVHRGPERRYAVGDKVWLSTKNRRKRLPDDTVAKFFARWEGPFSVISAHPETSTYTLNLPRSTNIHPTFHASLLKPFVAPNYKLFPARRHLEPPPLVFEDGAEEYFIDRIILERPRGRGFQYLVRWKGYGREHDEWLPGCELAGTDALKDWIARRSSISMSAGR